MSIETKINLAYIQLDFDAAENLWKTLASASLDTTKPILSLVRQRLVAQDYSGALHAARQAVKYWPKDPALQLRLRELDYLYGSNLNQQVVPVNYQMIQANEVSAESLLLNLKLYSHHISNTELIRLLTLFMRRWENHLQAERFFLSKLLLEGAYQDIVVLCQKRYAKEKKYRSSMLGVWIHALVELHRWNEALNLAYDGHTQGALNKNIAEFLLVHSVGQGVASDSALRSALEALCEAYKVEGIQQAIAFEQSLKPPLRCLIPTFCPTQSVICSPSTTADCLVILFSGGARRFPVPLTLLDRFFAGYGVVVVRLVDKNGSFYLDGISELGSSFEESVESLRKIAQGYGARKIITFGNSAGGVGALHYGVALNASHILVYSPLTNLSLSFFDQHSDYRSRPEIRKINQVVPEERLDVKDVIENSFFNGQIDIFVGEYCAKDLIHMNYLADLPQVSTHTVKGIAAHTVVAPSLLDGSLLRKLQCLVSS